MLAYALKRLMALVPVMLVASLTIFFIVRLAPGDPASALAGNLATADQIEGIRRSLALDAPLPLQYATWLSNALRGDLGFSFYSNQPVGALMLQRVEPTLSLAVLTIAISVVVSLTLGTLAAWRSGSALDRTVMAGTILGFSIPPFVVGYGLVFLFSVWLDWLPVQGYRPIAAGLGEWIVHLVLPVATLCTGYVALISRVVRVSLLEVLREDYIRTARAKGVAERGVILGHALGNAAVPISTVVGLGVAFLVGGVVVTETVFNIPGIGRLIVDAITKRDYPVIQGAVLVFSAIYVVINLAVDLGYAWFDPRIRY